MTDAGDSSVSGAAQDGVRPLALDYQRRLAGISADGWVIVDLTPGLTTTTVDPFPYVCCGCLATEIRHEPVQTNTFVKVRVPVCKECLRVWKRDRRVHDLISGGVPLILGTVAWFVLPATNYWLRFCGIAVAMLWLGVVLTFALPGRAGPVQLPRYMIRGEKTLRIRFRNPAFVALLQEAQQSSPSPGGKV